MNRQTSLSLVALLFTTTFGAGPLQAQSSTDFETTDFYFYAQKQTELYRGELLTKSEIERLATHVAHDIRRLATAKTETKLQSDLYQLRTLERTPYSLLANAQVLSLLDRYQAEAKKRADQNAAQRIVGMKQSLTLHLARLHTIAEVF